MREWGVVVRRKALLLGVLVTGCWVGRVAAQQDIGAAREEMARLQQQESHLLNELSGWQACLQDPECFVVPLGGPSYRQVAARVSRQEMEGHAFTDWLLEGGGLSLADHLARINAVNDFGRRMVVERTLPEIRDLIDKKRRRFAELQALVSPYNRPPTGQQPPQPVAPPQPGRQQQVTGSGLVWEFVAVLIGNQSQPPPSSVYAPEVTGDQGGGRASIAYNASLTCTERRTGQWRFANDITRLARGTRFQIDLDFSIAPPCGVAINSGVSFATAFRPQWVQQQAAGQLRELGEFVEAFGAPVNGANGDSGGDPRRLNTSSSVVVEVIAAPTAEEQLAEFRMMTGVPGYAVVASYLFRAVRVRDP